MLRKFLSTIVFSLFLIVIFSNRLFSQQGELSLFGGVTNYLGDLQQTIFSAPDAGAVAGLIYKYPLTSKWFIRAGLAHGKISAWDGNNEPSLISRNLRFESKVNDGYIAAEYRLFSKDQYSITPYAFTGVGVFHFNPYTFLEGSNEKIYLQPLGTEGQGLPEYPEKELYSLTRVMVPIGGGILWHVNERWTVGVELRHNFTFTDYIDDVSTNYALEAPLLRDRGQTAVDLAWRRDEYDGRPYPTNEGKRGNADNADWYYYAGINIAVKFPGGQNKKGGSFFRSKNQLGCPKW